MFDGTYYYDEDGDIVYPSSVWSSGGHQFGSTDAPYHDLCYTCGAMFGIVPDDPSDAANSYWTYVDLSECSRDTRERHGESECSDTDCPCQDHGEDPDMCVHYHRDCGCLFCQG